jgi:two-component system, response regulator
VFCPRTEHYSAVARSGHRCAAIVERRRCAGWTIRHDVELTPRAFARSNIVDQLVVVTDGEAALNYLFAIGPHADRDPYALPQAILLDLNLPKIGGFEVLRRIRADATTTRLPVIVLTTSREERDIITSYDLGANSYVRKSVDFAQFVEAARQLGLYWLALSEQPPIAGVIGNGSTTAGPHRRGKRKSAEAGRRGPGSAKFGRSFDDGSAPTRATRTRNAIRISEKSGARAGMGQRTRRKCPAIAAHVARARF